MLVMFIQIVVTLVVFAVIILFIRHSLQNKRNRYLEQEVEEVSKKHDKLLAEVLQPYHDSSDKLKLSRGKTKERYEELSEGFFSILHNAKEAQQNLDGLRVTRASYGSVIAVLPRAKSQLEEEFEKLHKLKQELEDFDQEDTHIASLEKEETANIANIEKQLHSLANKMEYPLTNLVQKTKYLKRELEEISSQIEQLDSMSAKKDLEHLQNDRIELEDRINRLHTLLREQRDIDSQFELKEKSSLPDSYERFTLALKAGEVDRAEAYLKKVREEMTHSL